MHHAYEKISFSCYLEEFRTTFTKYNNYAFKHAAIHCEWDEWTIGECSKTCGTGTRINNRTKLVEEANGGTCDGQPSAIEECNPEPCPGIQ